MARLTPGGMPLAVAGGLLARALLVAGLPALWPRVGEAQREAYPVDSARLEVTGFGDSSRVEGRYWFARMVRALDFTYLTGTCATVRRLAAWRNGIGVALAADSNIPWVALHDTTDATGREEGPVAWRVSYRVDHPGARRVAIPLVQPAGALDARGAGVSPKVHLAVIGDSSGNPVPEFPRFRRTSASRWSASMIAVPSTIVTRTPGAAGRAAPCEPAIGSEGENDGFTGRVALFVLTLVLWVPLYFWWAARRRPGEDAPP